MSELVTVLFAMFLSFQIQNFRGDVMIRVSLVSKDSPPKPHPHSLVGKDCENGICSVRVSPETQMTAWLVFLSWLIECMESCFGIKGNRVIV